MAGPWFRPLDDPTYLPHFRGQKNDLWELVVYDDGGGPQGQILVCLDACQENSKMGTPFTGYVVSASDDYYRWWLFDSGEAGDCMFHLCAGRASACRWRHRGKVVIHTDRVRFVNRSALEDGSVSWASKRECAKDIKNFFGDGPTAGVPAGHSSLMDVTHMGSQGDLLPAARYDGGQGVEVEDEFGGTPAMTRRLEAL
eukprot:5205373-Amphidinium_carterae.1